MSHGLMPKAPGTHPWSRDFGMDIACLAPCEWQARGACVVPSMCKIGTEGRCVGFTPKTKKPTKEPNGD